MTQDEFELLAHHQHDLNDHVISALKTHHSCIEQQEALNAKHGEYAELTSLALFHLKSEAKWGAVWLGLLTCVVLYILAR